MKSSARALGNNAKAGIAIFYLIAAGCWAMAFWRVRPEALGERVAERLQHDRQKVVFFKIDDDANYGRAVRIMDVCKGAGAQTLGIVTKE